MGFFFAFSGIMSIAAIPIAATVLIVLAIARRVGRDSGERSYERVCQSECFKCSQGIIDYPYRVKRDYTKPSK